MPAQNKLNIPCRTMNDLQMCLDADTHCVPTVEFSVRNFHAPLVQDDIDFLSAPEINLFSIREQTAQASARNTMAYSKALSDPTITFDIPFVMLGICVYAYADPHSLVIEGNQFGPQNLFGAGAGQFNQLPASPMSLRNTPGLLGGLFNAQEPPEGLIVCPSQIEWGGPVWRAMWAFLHAYRLKMYCYNNTYEVLLDESLADLGNCCSQVDWSGFGDSKASHIRRTRDVNDYLLANAAGFPGGVDPGFFVPINSAQGADGEITPQRYVADNTAYGRPQAYPAVEQWYRLPCPIPFPSIPQPKLKVVLYRAAGDEYYLQRMLEEMSIDQCLNPVPGIASANFPINEPDDIVAVADGGYGGMTRIPAGPFRLGIGFKGFEARESVCEEMYRAISGDTAKLMTQQGRLVQSPHGGTMCVPVGVMGPKDQGNR